MDTSQKFVQVFYIQLLQIFDSQRLNRTGLFTHRRLNRMGLFTHRLLNRTACSHTGCWPPSPRSRSGSWRQLFLSVSAARAGQTLPTAKPDEFEDELFATDLLASFKTVSDIWPTASAEAGSYSLQWMPTSCPYTAAPEITQSLPRNKHHLYKPPHLIALSVNSLPH